MTRRETVLRNFEKYSEQTAHRVKHGIELYRKGYARIKLCGRDGVPLCGVKVKAKLKNHEFLHGANIFMLDELETPEKNEKYKNAFAECFNEATVPIYWKDLEPSDGKLRFEKDSEKIYRRPPVELCLDFCEKHGITPKAHCLTYFNFDPEWVDEYDIPKLKKRIEQRYAELADRFADRIYGWEVINELLCTTMCREHTPFYESDTVMEDCFEMARKHFPYNELIVNEAVNVWESDKFAFNRSAYYQMVERAIKSGTKIDCVGLQFHQFNDRDREADCVDTLYNPHHIYKVLDRYAMLGRPLQITEITVPAYDDTAEDYELQAQIIKRLYEIWFSHPAVEAAIYWNLVDGYAAFAPLGDMSCGENRYRGGLMDFELNKKPAFDALTELFCHEWTTQTEVESNKDGEACFFGYYGDYEIEIGGKKYKFNMSSKHTNERTLYV